jgi:internalin A
MLFLHDNPKLGIPESILGLRFTQVLGGSGTPARPSDILTYYEATRSGGTPLNEVKLMIVGRGGAGKTSIRNRLVHGTFNPTERETLGVALDRLEIMTEQGVIKAHVWDFAGQEITHALHQFFFTERSVYILVLDSRADTQDQDAEYWLRLITGYGKDSPIIIALNKQSERQFDVDRFSLREKYPSLRGFIPTDCLNGDGIDALRGSLSHIVSAMETTRILVTEPWARIKDACWRHENNYLSLQGFRELCRFHGEFHERKQESLARILHHLGAVLHYIDDPRLRDTSVLNPHWVTSGVYTLLRHRDVPNGDGVLSFKQSLGALPIESEDAVRFLIRLMEKFEMCFPIANGEYASPDQDGDFWLVPGALPRYQPEIEDEWRSPDSIRIRYVYDLLPEGLLPQFIVRTFPLSEGLPRWRLGVIIRSDGAKALIRANHGNRTVEIVIRGRDSGRLRIAQLIRGHFDRLHKGLPGEVPREELLVSDTPPLYAPVATMMADEVKRQGTVINTPSGGMKIDETDQLNRISQREFRSAQNWIPKLFLSYAHKDLKYVRALQQHLTILENQKLLTQWWDFQIEPSTEWQPEIEKQLEEMDVFVGLVSTAFLASKFIQNVEVKRALERREKEGVPLLMVILEPCSWQMFEFGKFQAILAEGQPVRKFGGLGEAFYLVEEKLRTALRTLRLQKSESSREGG